MAKTVDSIKRNKKQVIKNFNPEEFEVYLKSLVNLYYESYLTQDRKKHLAVKELIEEAVRIYRDKYTNVKYNNLVYQVNKANELLGITIDEKDNLKVELSKVIVENGLDNKIDNVMFCNSILKRLIEAYEKEPSETLTSAIKDVAYRMKSHNLGTKLLIEKKHEVYTSVYAEEYELLEEEYSTLINSVKKINSF